MPSAPRLETLTRLGFAARGVLYLVIGYLAIQAGQTTGSAGALRSLADGGVGRLALIVIALGLLGYGVWRCVDAALDLEGVGGGAKGLTERLGRALSGVVHLGLAVVALGLAFGGGGGARAGGAGGEEAATGQLLALPGGQAAAGLVAVLFVLGGLSQAWSAYRLKFLKQLDQRAANKTWVRWVGRMGYLARGVVFVLVGILLWQAAATADPARAGGAGEALGSIDGWKRALVAAGLMLFGVFSLVQAAYRRITDPHVLARLGAAAHPRRRADDAANGSARRLR